MQVEISCKGNQSLRNVDAIFCLQYQGVGKEEQISCQAFLRPSWSGASKQKPVTSEWSSLCTHSLYISFPGCGVPPPTALILHHRYPRLSRSSLSNGWGEGHSIRFWLLLACSIIQASTLAKTKATARLATRRNSLIFHDAWFTKSWYLQCFVKT